MYLDRVRAGEELVVTDQGRAFAKVIPITNRRTFERLVAEGAIHPAPKRTRHRPRRPVQAEGLVSYLVAEQRR